MEAVADKSSAQPEILVARKGTDLTFGEVRAIIMRAALEPVIGNNATVAQVSSVLTPIYEIDALNNNNPTLIPILRRALRKQGRINRRLIDSIDALVKVVMSIHSLNNPEYAAKASELLARASNLNHRAKGSQFVRRMMRPQCQFNKTVNDVLNLTCNHVISSGRANTADIAAVVEPLRWHIKEAGYLASLYCNNPEWLRRARCDQYQVNRCHIIAVKLLCDLLHRNLP